MAERAIWMAPSSQTHSSSARLDTDELTRGRKATYCASTQGLRAE